MHAARELVTALPVVHLLLNTTQTTFTLGWGPVAQLA